jgi:4-diphosphocytidyl-2-C-methyl-D-erythritol kinase
MIVRRSPAKVNLFLRVLRKRADGYHDILSLMQRISLCDEMSFSLRDEGVVVTCPGTSLPEDGDNIVYRAAEAVLALADGKTGVEITIHKKIPVAAGLGGGSSNAATTLITLNEMAGTNLATEELIRMGARLGADVPFFVFGKTALVSGIGDRLEAVDGIPRIWFILVNPGFEISTREVYGRLGLTEDSIQYTMPRLTTVSRVAEELYNDLERVSLPLYPALSEIKRHLMAQGALGSLMSGSGSTVFGIFESEDDARKAELKLREARIGSVFVAFSI